MLRQDSETWLVGQNGLVGQGGGWLQGDVLEGELFERDGFGEAAASQFVEVLAFVGAVDAAGGFADAGEEDAGLGIGFGEGGDEGDGSAEADFEGGLVPRGVEAGAEGVVAGAGGVEGEGGGLGAGNDGEVCAPGDVVVEVVGEGLGGAGWVVAGGEAEADFGAGEGDELVDGLIDAGGVEGEDGDGGLGPEAGGEAAVADEVDAVERSGLLEECGVGEVERVGGGGGEAVDGDAAIVMVEGGEETGEGGDGVGQGAAEEAAVDALVEGTEFDDAVDEAAEGGGEGGAADAPVGGVGDDDGVGAEAGGVLGEEVGEVEGADLFFAFDEDFDVEGEVVIEGVEGGEVDGDAGFVVRCAAAEEAAVALDGFEGWGGPGGFVAGGLDVVVGVEEDGGVAGVGEAVAVDGGVGALSFEECEVVEAGVFEQGDGEFGGATDVVGVEAVGGDGGDADEGFQVVAERGEARVDRGANGVVRGVVHRAEGTRRVGALGRYPAVHSLGCGRPRLTRRAGGTV